MNHGHLVAGGLFLRLQDKKKYLLAETASVQVGQPSAQGVILLWVRSFLRPFRTIFVGVIACIFIPLFAIEQSPAQIFDGHHISWIDDTHCLPAR